MIDSKLPLPFRLFSRSVSAFTLLVIASHPVVSMPHAMATAARQFRFPSIPPLMTTDQVVPPGDAPVRRGSTADRPELTAVETAPSAREIVRFLFAVEISRMTRSNECDVFARFMWVFQLASVWRETPGVTFRLLRFYSLLFLVIRPLIRFKNPFRHGTQVVRELLGAVSTILLARFGFAIASVLRTSDPTQVPLIQLQRFAVVVATALVEHTQSSTPYCRAMRARP
jgi:hypothetical protein